VATSKIDQLINMVGELVITQSMLTQVGDDLEDEITGKRIERLREGLTTLERNTRELQESIMAIRMVPISSAFNRFPRLVRDLSDQLHKSIELVVLGEQTEIDKTLIERIVDPLVHLVRNAADHGIETPEVRLANGKAGTGTITLEAGHKGGSVVIEVRDDGRGLDTALILEKARAKGIVSADAKLNEAQIFDLIFAPGFSTAAALTSVSGRGVGMDVVKRNILALGGDVELRSAPGTGTTIRIVLPLTLAILDGQAIRVGRELYVIPLVSILESIRLSDARIRKPAGAIELLSWRDEHLPLLRLAEILDAPPCEDEDARGLVVIVEGAGLRAGIVVDDLLAQQQVVIKSLEDNFERLEGFSGATILGDGSIALILDVSGIIKLAGRSTSSRPRTRLELNT
jgi:two-component system chemotaxis sensor kinase CheA